MPYEFRMTHRVEFADTDMAGIVHFSSYFRYMEVTEHAFFRSLGLSIDARVMGLDVGWPRVHVACDFRRPLRFEDEVEAHLRVKEKGRRSITYEFVFRKVNDPLTPEVARGSLVVVCVALDPESGQMKAVSIPAVIADRIEVAPSAEESEPT
jgi:acyl-CoA thioester hydrolase